MPIPDMETLVHDALATLRKVVKAELAVKRAVPELSNAPEWAYLTALVRDEIDRLSAVDELIQKSKPRIITEDEMDQRREELREVMQWMN